MKYLLDTHVILWWLTEPKSIKSKAYKVISDRGNNIYLSAASFWEMSIKKGLGRLSLPHNLLETLAGDGFELLPFLPEETLGVADLPPLHSDPFDRLLIIQAKLNDLVLVTRDHNIIKYPVVILEA